MDQNTLDLVGLLDLNADANAVDARLDEDLLVLVARNDQRGQQDLGRRLGLDLGDIVSFGRLGGEVGEAEGRRDRAPHALEVRAEGLGLRAGLDRERRGRGRCRREAGRHLWVADHDDDDRSFGLRDRVGWAEKAVSLTSLDRLRARQVKHV